MTDNIQLDQSALFSIINGMDTNQPNDTVVEQPATSQVQATQPVVTNATNASSATVDAEDDAEEVNMDEYMSRFEKIQLQNEIGKQLISAITSGQHDQARVKALIDYVVHSQEQNEEMYNLLVDMNNLFGK
jgi:hypothetical protein